MTTKVALFCGHGSRDGEALAEVAHMAALLAERLPAWRVDHGFLQYARPTIAECLAALADAGARDILALPGMLFAAGHVKADIPAVIAAFGAQRPDVRVRFGRALAHDDGVLDAAQARIEEADGGVDNRATACLIVVGRGTADAEANATVGAVAEALKDRLGFGHAEAAFAGVAEPSVEAVVEQAARGFKRIVVLPYILFTGVLVKRLGLQIDEAAVRHPGAKFTTARHLGTHPRIVDAFVAGVHPTERAGDAMTRRVS